MNREKQAVTLIKQKMPQIKLLVGDDRKASIYASTLKQLVLNPNLKNVDVESVLGVAFEIVQAGLNPNPLFGQAYVVPYKGKAQLQIGYKGWINLSYRNGWKFRAVAVYDVDKFNIEFNGLSDKIDFKPNYDEREEENGSWVYKHLKGVIVYVSDKDGNIFSEFVPFKKLEKLRLKSPNQKAGSLQHIWLEWADEMYKAKAIKYVITRLPITEQMMEIVVKEDNSTFDNDIPMDTEPETKQNSEIAIDPIELTSQKNVTIDDFKTLYNNLNSEQKTEYLSFTQGVEFEKLNQQQLNDFYKEVKSHVGA